MIIWSSFLLDELAGLRNDALPSCPECKSRTRCSWPTTPASSPRSRARTAEPAQFGEIVSWPIGTDADDRPGQAVRRVHDERRLPRLARASPPRASSRPAPGTADDPTKYADACGASCRPASTPRSRWPTSTRRTCSTRSRGSLDTFNRWGFTAGPGRRWSGPIARRAAGAAGARRDDVGRGRRGARRRKQADDAVDERCRESRLRRAGGPTRPAAAAAARGRAHARAAGGPRFGRCCSRRRCSSCSSWWSCRSCGRSSSRSGSCGCATCGARRHLRVDFTLDNFADVLDLAGLLDALRTTLMFSRRRHASARSALGLAAALTCGAPFRGRGRSCARRMLLPYVAPVVAVTFVWQTMLDPHLGIVNALGHDVLGWDEPIPFLSSARRPCRCSGCSSTCRSRC